MDNSVLIGLLTGSLGTLIVKSILDFISRRAEHKRDLFKVTYQRKLEVAEKAAAYYYTYFSQIQQMKNAIKSLIKATNGESEMDIDTLADIIDQSADALTKLEGDSFHQSNAIHLYFDLDDSDSWSEQDFSELLERAATAIYRANEISSWSDEFDSLGDNADSYEEEYYRDKIKVALPDLISSLHLLVESLERNKNALEVIIRKLREQLKES